jgi:hypothetical protein
MKLDRVLVCTGVSWLGLWAHELHRVPALLGFTPDGDLFMLAIAAGLAYWWHRTHAQGAVVALFAYAAINLIGGGLSVLPLGWLPFAPAQTASHYAVHTVYAVCQLPLLYVTTSLLVRRSSARSG